MANPEFLTTKIRVTLRPWKAPRFACRSSDTENDADPQGISVAELDDDALEDMALAWLQELYKNAGRRNCPYSKRAKAG